MIAARRGLAAARVRRALRPARPVLCVVAPRLVGARAGLTQIPVLRRIVDAGMCGRSGAWAGRGGGCPRTVLTLGDRRRRRHPQWGARSRSDRRQHGPGGRARHQRHERGQRRADQRQSPEPESAFDAARLARVGADGQDDDPAADIRSVVHDHRIRQTWPPRHRPLVLVPGRIAVPHDDRAASMRRFVGVTSALTTGVDAAPRAPPASDR
jgi:hypothetical protein